MGLERRPTQGEQRLKKIKKVRLPWQSKWLRHQASAAEGLDPIPGQGTRSPKPGSTAKKGEEGTALVTASKQLDPALFEDSLGFPGTESMKLQILFNPIGVEFVSCIYKNPIKECFSKILKISSDGCKVVFFPFY